MRRKMVYSVCGGDAIDYRILDRRGERLKRIGRGDKKGDGREGQGRIEDKRKAGKTSSETQI